MKELTLEYVKAVEDYLGFLKLQGMQDTPIHSCLSSLLSENENTSVSQILEDAAASYEKEVSISEPSEDGFFDEKELRASMKKAEVVWSHSEDKIKQDVKLKNEFLDKKSKYRVFTKDNDGNSVFILHLNTKKELVVGDKLCFGIDLLNLYQENPNDFTCQYEIMDIRYVFDLKCMPNVRGEDDFQNTELLVRAVKEEK